MWVKFWWWKVDKNYYWIVALPLYKIGGGSAFVISYQLSPTHSPTSRRSTGPTYLTNVHPEQDMIFPNDIYIYINMYFLEKAL